MSALYQIAWLRRFVSPGSGYLAAILPLLPCIIQYSHAILLNVPAFALQLAACYHARRWLEERQENGQLYLAIALSLVALLCYQGTFVLLLVFVPGCSSSDDGGS